MSTEKIKTVIVDNNYFLYYNNTKQIRQRKCKHISTHIFQTIIPMPLLN